MKPTTFNLNKSHAQLMAAHTKHDETWPYLVHFLALEIGVAARCNDLIETNWYEPTHIRLGQGGHSLLHVARSLQEEALRV